MRIHQHFHQFVFRQVRCFTSKANVARRTHQSQRTVGSPAFRLKTARFGQHLLDADVCKEIVSQSGLLSGDTVLEVGPGTGNLTTELFRWRWQKNNVPSVEGVSGVVAVEADPRMVVALTKRFSSGIISEGSTLNTISGDVITIANSDIPQFDICISNVPYKISSPLIYKLLELTASRLSTSHSKNNNNMENTCYDKNDILKLKIPRCFVLMLQEEFVDRLTALPGSRAYSRLTVNTRLQADTHKIMVVSREKFTPPPNVESAVVRITPKHAREVIKTAIGSDVSSKEVLQLIDRLDSGGSFRNQILNNSTDDFEFIAANAIIPIWDSMTRICFHRKNRTLRAIFKQVLISQMFKINPGISEKYDLIVGIESETKYLVVPGTTL